MSPPSIDRRCRVLLGAFTCALWVAPALPVGAEDDAAPTADRTDEAARAPLCDTQLKLGATFYVHETPDQSLALMRTPKTQAVGLYRPGMYVEGFEVITVEPRGVLLARDDAYCWLRLQPDPSRPQPAPPPPPRKAKRKR